MCEHVALFQSRRQESNMQKYNQVKFPCEVMCIYNPPEVLCIWRNTKGRLATSTKTHRRELVKMATENVNRKVTYHQCNLLPPRWQTWTS